MFSIGPHTLDSRVLLAPMAGITDLPFREICHDYGAGLVTSEMITSDTSLWSSRKTKTRLATSNTTTLFPYAIQIAGTEPEQLAEAAVACEKMGADIVDINMGCPAKKVCKKLAGSALMKDLNLVQKILSKTVSSVKIPVTLKTRTGWDTKNKNGIEVAKIAEAEGIKAITIHGRTRECRFKGSAEYDSIAKIVSAVNIPVIANGDIDSPQKAADVLKKTNADGVMLGRSVLGRPWLISQTNEFLKEQNSSKLISFDLQHQLSTVIRHLKGIHAFYGELQGVRIARKHIGWYVSHLDPLLAESSNVKTSFTTRGFAKEFNSVTSPLIQLNMVYDLFKYLLHKEDKAA